VPWPGTVAAYGAGLAMPLPWLPATAAAPHWPGWNRMEAAVAFGTLLHRCPDLELATPPGPHPPSGQPPPARPGRAPGALHSRSRWERRGAPPCGVDRRL